METTVLTSKELREKMDNGESILVLDVRDTDKFLAGSFEEPGIETLNLPYLLLRDEPEKVEDVLHTLPKNIEIVTVCTTGNKAQKAANLLREKGLRAVSLNGGLTDWKSQPI